MNTGSLNQGPASEALVTPKGWQRVGGQFRCNLRIDEAVRGSSWEKRGALPLES